MDIVVKVRKAGILPPFDGTSCAFAKRTSAPPNAEAGAPGVKV
jgi:hypothetical protein